MVRHQNIPPRNRYVFALFLTHLRTIQQTKLLFHRFLMVPSLIELDDGNIYRKTLYLMVKTMVFPVDFPLNQSNDSPLTSPDSPFANGANRGRDATVVLEPSIGESAHGHQCV